MSEQIQNAWIDKTNKRSTLYEDGARDFVSFSKTKLGGSACPCPCKNCRNRFRLEYDMVEDHLNLNSIDLSYRVWVLHGERRSQTLMEHPVVGNMEEKNIEEEGLGRNNFVDAYMGHGIEKGDIEPPFVPEPDLGPNALQPPPSGQATPPSGEATPPVTSESSGAPSSKQKNPNVKVRREDDWLTSHERHDGSILESAHVAYALKGSGCVTVSLYNASRFILQT
ncbi:hypothetical protein IFM89_001042 [Coptis chinensis]|uniref:Transposase-associated domain-containing protein n=1 Tax=Coptis chinensis TaxID=261450 RepID=A0A835LI20_9MAGN|nr:hypothetical protein IFM89_001042 [Coptis chinensis]